MRLAVGTVPQDQILMIKTALLDLYSPTANDIVNARIRYTTDGSVPTTASSVLPGSVIQRRLTGAGIDEMAVISTHYTPGVGENLTILLTVGRSSGSGNAQILGSATQPIKIIVVAGGTDPGDTGVDY